MKPTRCVKLERAETRDERYWEMTFHVTEDSKISAKDVLKKILQSCAAARLVEPIKFPSPFDMESIEPAVAAYTMEPCNTTAYSFETAASSARGRPEECLGDYDLIYRELVTSEPIPVSDTGIDDDFVSEMQEYTALVDTYISGYA